MKTILLLISLILFGMGQLTGKIRNGYEVKLAGARISLARLNSMLLEAPEMPAQKKQKVKKEIVALIKFICCYELTDQLLNQLRAISPAIYDEIDNIRDKRGRTTDVYVKLVSAQEAGVPLQGISVFSRAAIDEDANFSEYGDYTVSVSVWIPGNALLVLCHELGHVRYVIPNLASYRAFYETHYNERYQSLSYVGHNVRDESGKSADAFMRRYIMDKVHYIRAGGKRPTPAVSLMQRIQRKHRGSQVLDLPETVLSTLP